MKEIYYIYKDQIEFDRIFDEKKYMSCYSI